MNVQDQQDQQDQQDNERIASLATKTWVHMGADMLTANPWVLREIFSTMTPEAKRAVLQQLPEADILNVPRPHPTSATDVHFGPDDVIRVYAGPTKNRDMDTFTYETISISKLPEEIASLLKIWYVQWVETDFEDREIDADTGAASCFIHRDLDNRLNDALTKYVDDLQLEYNSMLPAERESDSRFEQYDHDDGFNWEDARSIIDAQVEEFFLDDSWDDRTFAGFVHVPKLYTKTPVISVLVDRYDVE